MPAPAKQNATASSLSSPPPPLPRARAAIAATSKARRSSARSSHGTSTPKARKCKRKVMAKGDRKNKKDWAKGAREDIMLAHLPKYTEELAKGPKFAADYAVKICHEFNYKIPYDMPDDVEPDTIPEYNCENPPPLPKLSDEKEKERAAALAICDKRVVNWLKYRARKVVPAIPKGSNDINNTFSLWMMRLTGTSRAPKKARQGWQQYQHENPDLVQDSAQRAWDAKKGQGGGIGDRSGRESGSRSDSGSEEEDDVSDGTGKKGKGVGFISKHARELFNKLPASEQQALKTRAKAEKEAEKKRWEKAINAPPSQEPPKVQVARNALPSFLNPIIDGVNQHAGGAHVLVLVGGRDPSKGGAVTVQHYNVGVNKQDVDFRDWDRPRFNCEVLSFFGEYLHTVWDDDECAKMALAGLEEGQLKGALGDAHYRFNSVTGGEDGEDFGNGDDGGHGEDYGNGDDFRNGNDNLWGAESNGGDPLNNGYISANEDQPPSKRQRTDKGISETNLPKAASAVGGADEQRAQPPSSRPMRPKPRPTRTSARTSAQIANAPDPSAGSTPTTTSTSTSIGPNVAGQPDLAGIPINPVLCRPPYVQVAHPGIDASGPSTTSHSTSTVESRPEHDRRASAPSAPLPTPAPPMPAAPISAALSTTSAPNPVHDDSMHASTTSRASTHTLHDERVAAVFPDAPEGAVAWFATALGMMRVELGEEWVRPIGAWARYESHRKYGEDLPARSSRLDGARSRPREVSTWIAGSRWRSPGCEPVRKSGQFASTLMRGWWAWYLKLVPDWREEDETGRLHDFDDFGEGMGGLDVPGINGVLSLIACLKWVGEALVSGVDVQNREDVDCSWRRATTDLSKMLEGVKGL